jgi:membrane-associated protease RseP (regulator of RpoE activity)
MASPLLLVSTVLMALVVAVVVAEVVSSHSWRGYSPRPAIGGEVPAGGRREPGRRSVSEVVASKSTWLVLFVMLSVALLAAIVAILAGDASTATIAGLFAVLVLGYLALGIYATVRSRGNSVSRAVLAVAGALAGLYVLAIAVRLLMV